jgi:uncharacterized protein DUF2154
MSELARRAAAAALVALAALPAGAEAQRMRGMTSARQLSGEQALDVEVQYGAGRLSVGPEASSLMYRMEMRYDEERWRPVAEYGRESGRLRLGLSGVRGHEEIRSGAQDYARVSLTPSVPLDLDLEFGAGRAEVELGGLSLRGLELSTGASETRLSFSRPNRVAAKLVRIEAGAASIEVVKLGNARAELFEFEGGLGEATLDFTGTWTRSARATIHMGVGSVRLRLPRGLGVRVEKDSFLASFDAPGMVRRGNAWFSRDYESATHRLDIAIDAAIGSINIDWVD